MNIIRNKSTEALMMLDPSDPENLAHFSRKWRVKVSQIKEGILSTGSLHPPTIIEYLRRDNLLYHPIEGLKHIYRATLNFMF